GAHLAVQRPDESLAGRSFDPPIHVPREEIGHFLLELLVVGDWNPQVVRQLTVGCTAAWKLASHALKLERCSVLSEAQVPGGEDVVEGRLLDAVGFGNHLVERGSLFHVCSSCANSAHNALGEESALWGFPCCRQAAG